MENTEKDTTKQPKAAKQSGMNLVTKVTLAAMIPLLTSSVVGIWATFSMGNLAACGVLAALLVIGAVAIVFVTKQVGQGFAGAVNNLDRVAEGKLDYTVSERVRDRNDEVGNIARSVEMLVGKLGSTINDIHGSMDSLNEFSVSFRSNFDKINDSISSVNGAIEEIANGATSQAEETQKVSREMNEMGIAIDNTSVSVDDLLHSTEEMKSQNQMVGVALQELAEISRRTQESIEQLKLQSDETNRSAEEIRNVVDLIGDIASQTNLLSLNASIEAARAGEQGRGFAVVADEVRNLAEQSRESALQISEIVEQLIAKSNISVETMAGVGEEIEHQNDKLNSTEEAFQALNTEITSVSGVISSISEQVNALNHSKSTVQNGLEGLAAIAEQNAASTQETAASMMELETVVRQCNEATGELNDIADGMNVNVNAFHME